jgi:hypothetical protein
MSKHSEFGEALKTFVRKVGAPNGLFTDNAKNEISKDVGAYLNTYGIKDMQSELEYQNQNPSERGIQDVKKTTRGLMDRTNTPGCYWLLCTLYVIALFNVLAVQGLEWKTSFEAIYGYRPDISPWLAYRWWQAVFFTDTTPDTFPHTHEKLGRVVAIGEGQRDLMTWGVLDLQTLKVVWRSEIRAAVPTKLPNLRAEAKIHSGGGESETQNEFENSEEDQFFTASELLKQALAEGYDPHSESLPAYSPDELMGKTFLKELETREKVRVEVVKKINDMNAQNHQKIKFLVKLPERSWKN